MSNPKPVFAFCADTHLRAAAYGKAYRGVDFFNALMFVIKRCKELGINTILHGGDFCDARQLDSIVIDQITQIVDALEAAKIGMIMVTGNHDISNPTWNQVIENRFNHPKSRWGIVDGDFRLFYTADGYKPISIYGLPFMDPDSLRERLYGEQFTETADILLWHGAVKEFAAFDAQSLSIVDFMGQERFKHILLGDIHVTKFVTAGAKGDRIIGYPGSTELTKDKEEFDKSFTVFWQDENGALMTSQEAIPTRKAIGLRILVEEQMEQALQVIRETYDQVPMIFVSYNPMITDIVRRLNAARHPDSIFRHEPRDMRIPKELQEEFGSAPGSVKVQPVLELSKPLSAFVGNHVPQTSTELYTLAMALVDPTQPEKPAALLKRYVDSQLTPATS